MRHQRLAAFSIALLSPAFAQTGEGQAAGTTVQDAPPGFVKIEGGNSFVGTPTEVIREHLDGKWGERFKESLTSESPGKQQRVETFWVQNSEVTNRQYHAFVTATGHRPPFHWCHDAVTTARTEHEARQEALKQADPNYEPLPFDGELWWEANAKDCEWKLPAGEEDFPVNYVSFRDAQAYCTWAGLRMITEAEWSRAARGDGREEYIWGADWDARKCLNIETSRQKLASIGSFPQSMTESGLFDVAGSVYEWTTSPFDKLPGFEPLELTVKVGNKKVRETVDVTWHPSWKVIKGGSYMVNDPRFATRIGHRLPAPPEAYSEQIGFRPGRTDAPGVDHMRNLSEFVLPYDLLGKDGDIDPYGAVGIESWTVLPIGAAPGIAAPGGNVAVVAKTPVPGYGVIVQHNTRLFAPVKQLPTPTEKVLAAQSLKDPVVVGVLSISEPSEALGLQPGTYVVKYRAAGRQMVEKEDKKDEKKDDKKDPKDKKEAKGEKKGEEKAEEEIADEEIADEGKDGVKVDHKKENLLFYEAETRELRAALGSSSEWIKKASKPKRGEVLKSELGEWQRNRSTPKYEQFKIILDTSSRNVQFELTFQLDKIEK